MAISKTSVFSDLPVSPGASLVKELEARGMTEQELATKLDWPEHRIDGIVSGKDGITAETASGLEQALGISAEFWLNLEAIYRGNAGTIAESKSGLAAIGRAAKTMPG